MSIKVENLSKYYGQQQAVKNISFEIKSGEVVGFLGPNGAGKSTTMKMITTYLTPNEGAINVDGIDTNEDALSVRKKIGYLPEQNPLYNDMNVIDYLNYAAELQSVQKDEIPEAVKKMVKLCKEGKCTAEGITQVWASYLGYAKHCSAYKTTKNIHTELQKIIKEE